MAYVDIPGMGFGAQMPFAVNNGWAFSGNTVSASTHTLAFCGRFYTKDHSLKTIQGITFRVQGTPVTAGGSFLRVSLQSIANTTPLQPTATVLASVDTQLTKLTANAGFITGALSANVVVANPGDLLAVCFSLVSFSGSDACGIGSLSANARTIQCATMLNTSGTWTVQSLVPVVVLNCTDGTSASLYQAFPCTDVGTYQYNTSSTTSDWGMEFQLPMPVKVDGAWATVDLNGSTSNASMALLDGSTLLGGGSSFITGTMVAEVGPVRQMYVNFPSEVTLSSNHSYRLMWTPTTTNNVQLGYLGVSNVSDFQILAGGIAGGVTASRQSATNNFTSVTSQRPQMGLMISAADNGAGSASTTTVLYNPRAGLYGGLQ